MNKVILLFSALLGLHVLVALFLVLTNHPGWLYLIYRNIFFGTFLLSGIYLIKLRKKG